MKDTQKIIKSYLKQLPCRLTTEEFQQRAGALANVAVRKGELEAEQERVKAEWKVKESSIKGDFNRLSQVIRERQEPRDVKVEEHADYVTGRVDVLRTDTQVVLEERPLTDGERQVHFDFEKKRRENVITMPPPKPDNH